MRTRAFLSWLFVSVLLLTGCGQTLLVSGTTLKTSGEQFRAVADAYVEGCKAKTIGIVECAKFKEFGEKFKASFPLAVKLWLVAKDANDAKATKSAQQVIRQTVADLTGFTVTVLDSLKGGK